MAACSREDSSPGASSAASGDVGPHAELAGVAAGRLQDDELLQPLLDQAARIHGAAELAERRQQLRPEAHGLDHLQRALAPLEQLAALAEIGPMADRRERAANLLVGNGHAHPASPFEIMIEPDHD
jgi:hypothetical protein